MPRMYYRAQDGTLVPVGGRSGPAGPAGPAGPTGPQGDPGELSQAEADTRYVKKSGDKMTGNLEIASSSIAPSVVLDSTDGLMARLVLRQGAKDRWIVQKSGVPEVGGVNAGSDFIINRRADDGSSLGDAVTINRASGAVTLGRSTVASDLPLTVATKDYVDVPYGTGSPEGVLFAQLGARYRQTDSPLLSKLLWIKTTDGGGTGWLPDFEGRWVDYVPTWTATGGTPTLGNGSLIGAYTRTGRTVDFRCTLTWGSTTSAAGTTDWRIGPPLSVATQVPNSGMVLDTGTRWHVVGGMTLTSTSGIRGFDTASGSLVGSAVPMAAWATGDSLTYSGTYETNA